MAAEGPLFASFNSTTNGDRVSGQLLKNFAKENNPSYLRRSQYLLHLQQTSQGL
jgi:hypothetical protein